MAETKREETIVRAPDLVERYAHNVRFERTIWDINLLFGTIDQTPSERLTQHTSIRMPWAEAKIVVYYLYLNILLHEAGHPIAVPPEVIPPKFRIDQDETTKVAKAIAQRVETLHADLFASR